MTKDTTSLQSLKSWLFPSVVSILGILIWQDVTEIKSDVKALMAQSNIDKTRIDAIEKQLDMINGRVFRQTASAQQDKQLPPDYQTPGYSKEGIREEEFDIKKYLTLKNI